MRIEDINPESRAFYVAQILILSKRTKESIDYINWVTKHDGIAPPRDILYQACIDIYDSIKDIKKAEEDKRNPTPITRYVVDRFDEILEDMME